MRLHFSLGLPAETFQLGDLALFNLALDSKLRSCDPVKIKVSDVAHGLRIAKRSTVIQMKTKRPVRFEITKQPRESLADVIKNQKLSAMDYLLNITLSLKYIDKAL